MLLATQYYRPPFPARTRFADDLRDIRAAGLGAIGLWAVWGWIEAQPGEYRYDEFDELVELAAKNDLDVVITASAELNPYWIHREIPDSHMIDHTGRAIESSTLSYTHSGISPGGCTDHPVVRERQGAFMRDLGRHFAGADNLIMWDCWNEIRWAVQTDGHVCFCRHTVAAFRAFLQQRYGSLDALNEAWHRRYVSWDDVQPGKQPGRAWLETMAFCEFLAARSADDASFRAASIRAGDPDHPVMAHSVIITPYQLKGESQFEQYLARGNTYELGRRLDAFGVSNFPGWFQGSWPEYGARLESARGSAGGRPFWLSELQGGASMNGIMTMDSISAETQQMWIWNAYARGSKAVNFWCWRDEIFGRESSGFGIVGDDGHAKERVAALTATTAVLAEHGALLDAYTPEPAKVGVIFEPRNYLMEWSYYGFASTQAEGSFNGYLLALERLQLTYDILDASHLTPLDQYELLIVPWTMIVTDELGEALAAWVGEGGQLVVETETGAHDELAFYRYADERPLPRALGFEGLGRRALGERTGVRFTLGEQRDELRAASWLEPLAAAGAEVLAELDGEPYVVRTTVGAGKAIAIGTHAGLAYCKERYPGFEAFLGELVAQAGAGPSVRCSEVDGQHLQFRFGRSGSRSLLFVTNDGPARDVTFSAGPDVLGDVSDLLDGTQMVARDGALTVRLRAHGCHVFVGR